MTLSYSPDRIAALFRHLASVTNRAGELAGLRHYLGQCKYREEDVITERDGKIEDIAEWLFLRRPLHEVTKSFDL